MTENWFEAKKKKKKAKNIAVILLAGLEKVIVPTKRAGVV